MTYGLKENCLKHILITHEKKGQKFVHSVSIR